MKSYTYQIGEGIDDVMSMPTHSESIYADSLGEAIDKAEAITRLRPDHAKESMVRVIESTSDEYPLWASSVKAIRNA